MSVVERGTVEVCGKDYDYTIYLSKNGSYTSVVQDCKAACCTKDYEITKNDIMNFIYQYYILIIL